jgi:glycosyltransferase involved in cell wall biosynthesis
LNRHCGKDAAVAYCLYDRPGTIRVCFLIDRLCAGGTELQLLALLRHLDRRRVRPYLALLDGDDAQSRALEPRDDSVLRLGIRSLHQPATLTRARDFVQWLGRERIEVVQTYFPDSTYFGVPLARLAGCRVVRTRFNQGYWLTPTRRWLGRLLNRMTNATITNCEACRQSVIADEWADKATTFVLENGIDHRRFEAIPTLNPAAPTHRPPRIGLLANLRPVKAPDLFVQAARLVADVHPTAEFQIAGDGEMRADLEHLIGSLGLQQRVQLVGNADAARFLRDIDIAVLCSHSEGMSNAILEYMAAGRAIVATAVGGTPQLIDHGAQGLLVAPGQSATLAQAILRYLGNWELAGRLGGAARRRVLERFTHEVRARRYEEFYRRLVRRDGASVLVGPHRMPELARARRQPVLG